MLHRQPRILWTLSLVCAGLFACASPGDEIGEKGQGLFGTSADGRYIVHFRPSVQAVVGARAVDAVNGQVVRVLAAHGAVAAQLSDGAAQTLAADPSVDYVEPDARRYPMAQVVPYGISMVQADQVPATPRGGEQDRVKVCVIDSGYSRGHADLFADPLVTGTSDPGTGNWYQDGLGHGTHVAGTIAALSNDVGVVGVGPGAITLHIVKVFNDIGGWTYSSDLVGALDVCRQEGARVVSMSLGGTSGGVTEANAFADALAANVLPIAAAGNAGNTSTSYPAGHAAVVSVAAVDSTMAIADFSQRNADVELSAPGVDVLSTVPPGTGRLADVTVGVDAFANTPLDGSPNASGTGPLVECGLAQSACPGGGGQVCLIQRGTNTFANKVVNCQSGGGVAAIIYNNIPGSFSGTLGGTNTNIPSVGISDSDGAALLARLGEDATVTVGVSDYGYNSGTSMATPHVSGVAALVWSHNPTWTAEEIRSVLQATALDLGSAGRDPTFGFGLVQARAAYDIVADLCPDDPDKMEPGVCGCGVPDVDSDNDGTLDCLDGCPNDADKLEPGICGCGVSDADTDDDGMVDCQDACPLDADNDIDQDGVCGDVDNCPALANPDQADSNQDGVGDACTDSGCGCRVGGVSSMTSLPSLGLFLLGLVLVARRSRRRR